MKPFQALRMRNPSIGDPNWSSVVFLTGFESVSGSTITDESSYHHTGTYTASGSGTGTTSAQAKFGTNSFVMGSTGRSSHLNYADSADWCFGSGNYTVECWARFDLVNTTDLQHLFGQYDTGLNQRAWALSYGTSGLTFFRSSNGTAGATVAAAWAYTQNTWYHLAVDWDGAKLRLYVNGVMKGSSTTAVTIFDSTAPLSIGTVLNSGATNTNFQGYLDEIRITKGAARYASDAGFTPPSAAFPRS